MNRAAFAATIGGVVLALGIAAGAFFLGQGTRLSDLQVAERVEAAVDRTTDEQKQIRRKAVGEARRAQKRHDRRVIRRVRRKLEKAAERRAQQSYASGQSVGYSSGSREGFEEGSSVGFDEGMNEASDDLACSDDPDVSWLPFC